MKDKNKTNKNPLLGSILEHLAEDTVRPDKLDLWPGLSIRLAASRTLSKRKEPFVNKRILFPAFTAALVLALVAILIAQNVTTVSAESILDKAYVAQSQASSTAQGIEHIRTEIYSNPQALPEEESLVTTIESYRDLQSGNFRNVTIDNKTGRVLDAFAYDGSYTYSQDYRKENANNGDLLTVYRTPQGQIADLKSSRDNPQDASNFFNKMRQDPNVELLGKETWADGRPVYVLQSYQQVKAMIDGQVEFPMGLVTAYFDVNTYEQLGFRMTMEKDGQEVLLGSQKILVSEILPAGTQVDWSLNDVQGIEIVDDPNREHGDLLPEVITPEQLAARTESAYLLQTIPDGYTLEISEPQVKAGSDEPYLYIASYRTETGDYFVIQSIGPEKAKMAAENLGETYTTANGLTITFLDEGRNKSDQFFSSAIVETSQDTSFVISSTLPQEQVKELMEDLVLVSK